MTCEFYCRAVSCITSRHSLPTATTTLQQTAVQTQTALAKAGYARKRTGVAGIQTMAPSQVSHITGHISYPGI